MPVPVHVNRNWGLGISTCAITDRRRFWILAIVDDFARRFRRGHRYVTLRRLCRSQIGRLIAARGNPITIVSDDRRKFTCPAILCWFEQRRVDWHFIAPGRPQQNAFVESFKRRLRGEMLFSSLLHARSVLAAWRAEFNQTPPHSSLGNLPPEQFAQQMVLARGAA